MKVVYVAHRLGAGPDREQNRRDAADWCGWIARRFGVAISADWIVLSGVWDESMRAVGLATDLEMVSRADEVWQVGPALSPGMRLEGLHAELRGKPVLNLTGLSRDEILTRLGAPSEARIREMAERRVANMVDYATELREQAEAGQ